MEPPKSSSNDEGKCPKYVLDALDLRAWGSRLMEFVRAVVPLTLFCVGYIRLFLGVQMLTVRMTLGMLSVIIGLAMFKFGLLTGLMTLGEMIGLKLPFRVSSVAFVMLAFGLGVLVTFAEPGINSLQIVGKVVKNAPPLLNDVLTVHSSQLLISIALGVGVAASVGMQRIKLQWSIKSVIWASLTPLLIVTVLCTRLGPAFDVVIGLAWDCGAITTGPATVPIVLALGFGMCRTRKLQKEDPNRDERIQILTTMLDRWSHQPEYKAISDAMHTKVDISDKPQKRHSWPPENSMLRRKSLPNPTILQPFLAADDESESPVMSPSGIPRSQRKSMSTDDATDLLEQAGKMSLEVDPKLFHKFKTGGEDLDCFGIVTLASLYPIFTVLIFCALRFIFCSAEDVAEDAPNAPEPIVPVGFWTEIPGAQIKAALIPVTTLSSFLLFLQFGAIREPIHDFGRIAVGILSCFIGLTIFDIGLQTGSVPLGEQAGTHLPDAFDDGEESGLGVILVFGFITGCIATIIDLEPCGLGETVELLSNGKFTKLNLFVAVSFGVGMGIVIGMCKIIYDFSVIYVIFIGYAMAMALTHISDDGITCVAWDSAGVTTGPITVPLVLSMGVGICNKGYGTNGFGVLTCASVCPIISVLLMGLYKIGRKRADPEE